MKKIIRRLSLIAALCILFAACGDDPRILGNMHIVTSVSTYSSFGKKYKVGLLSVDRTEQQSIRLYTILYTDVLYTVGDTIEIK